MSDRVAATQQTADVGRRLEMHPHEMTSPNLVIGELQQEIREVEPVRELLTDAMQQRLREVFAQVMAAQTFKADDLTAGRAYINSVGEPRMVGRTTTCRWLLGFAKFFAAACS